MKAIYKLTLLVSILWLSLGVAKAQSPEVVLDQVTRSLTNPRAVDQIGQYFEDRVEISLLGKRQAYSRTQAQYVLGQFVADYGIGRFNLIQKGQTSDTIYAVGECQTAGGNVEVNIFIRLSSGRVSEMQFERR
ncbi:MAG: DUF4783 domain-containing protein [Bacteroidota bacterium]